MNIVFDLGGVILTWNPQAIIAAVFDDEASRALAWSQVFNHRDWVALDRGTLALDAAIAGAALRTGLPEADLVRLFQAVPPSLVPIPQMVDLLGRLKQKGHALYCLSNMHSHSLTYLQARYTFWELFEGAVFSCLVHLCKPEPAIYAHLVATFGLAVQETLFLDDMEVNLEAANSFGIRTIHVQSPGQCERELKAMGCL